MKQHKVIGLLLLAVYLLMCYHTVIPHDHHTHHAPCAVAENHVLVGLNHHHDADADDHHHFPHHSEESHSTYYLSAKVQTPDVVDVQTAVFILPAECMVEPSANETQFISHERLRPKIPKPYLNPYSHRGPPTC